jgi:hypothetical protein
MLPEIANFIIKKEEPVTSYLFALREHILKYDEQITEAWKFNMPFFYYKDERFCYLSVYKNDGMPYIGFIEGTRFDHPELVIGDRARIKILPLDASAPLPIGKINSVLEAAMSLYK